MRANLLEPSQLCHVLGATDPASILDRNWPLIATHLVLTLPATGGLDSDQAPAAVQANFAAIAAALSVALVDVSSSFDAEAATETNLERINALW